jgi:hypothetical protein
VRSRITLVAAWLAATALSILIAGAAVGSVRNNVTDRPSQLAQPELIAAPIVDPPTTAPIGSEPDLTSGPPATGADTDPAAASTVTTTLAGDGTPTSTVAPAQTTTAAPPAPATTTSQAAQWQLATYETGGGWVRIRYTSAIVELDAYGPAPGYRADVERSGPEEVKVEFDGGDDKEYSISAKLEGGRLAVEIEPGN